MTFVGPKTLSDDIATEMGTKGMGIARGGSVDLHGFQFHPSWTRMAAAVLPGDTHLYLQDPVNWRIGQQIVIATSIYRDYEENQNEVVTIVAMSADGTVLEVSPAFNFVHYAGSEYQTEVGLLSRSITLQGDSRSEDELFGGHVMVMGEGRFSGVRFYRMGQQNMLARYPVHWHLIGRSPMSFAKDNSFVDSYYRCISIHATHETTVLRNVAFNVAGHCYYLEEGVEENNTISYNLAIRVRCIGSVIRGFSQVGEVWSESANAILPADRAASGFYITNAYNTFIGNAASGGWSGFSFPNLPTPLGFNRATDFVPQSRPIKVFDGNTVHSSGYHFVDGGGCIYVGGKLWYDGATLMYDSGRNPRYTSGRSKRSDPLGDPQIMKFSNLKAWLCQLSLSHWGERVEVQNVETHDVARSLQLFGAAWVSNALINARTASPVGLPPDVNNRGFQFYDTFVMTYVTNVSLDIRSNTHPPPSSILSDIEFRNFRARRNSTFDNQHGLIMSMTHSDRFKPQGISVMTRIKYTNCDRDIRIWHPMRNTGSVRHRVCELSFLVH
jgi:hypothetical protein